MEAQNYANHRRFVPTYHYVLFGLIALTLIGSFINLYQSIGDHQRLYSASLIVVMMICLLMVFFFSRTFSLKAQDRAIRAEENLRHWLTVRQIIGLRFAFDEEFVPLAQRASEGNLSEDEIKKAIKSWRADTCRV